MSKNLKRAWVFKWLGFALSLSLVLFTASLMVFYGLMRTKIPQFSSISEYKPALTSKVFADNGELIAEFGLESRIIAEKSEIPLLLSKTFLVAEDKNFYSHHGIDFLGILSALKQSLSGKRSTLRGASTITQQLAKGLLVSVDGYDLATARTFSRKFKEAIFARHLERNFSKDDILWMYLNQVYLGHSSYGIKAAAKHYFSKELSELSLGQMAVLAGLPQAPSRYSPLNNPKEARARQHYVLTRLYEDGVISLNDQEQALNDKSALEVVGRENNFRKLAPYFAEEVRKDLIKQYGEQKLYNEGLNIYTTLDIERQQILNDVLKQGIIEVDKRQGFSGPIFRPKNQDELKKSLTLLTQINSRNDFLLGGDYALAQVSKVDESLDAVFIDTGLEKGVIALCSMAWARKPNPELSYASSLISSVRRVLVDGDVVLVKKENLAKTEHRANTAYYQNNLKKLISYIEPELSFFSLEQEPEVEGAMVVIEPSSGYVQAMNGGYSFDKSEFNRIIQACRQPGSLFKPIVYSAAIALKGYNPATMLMDVPLTFRDSELLSSWKPKNFEQSYSGEVTVRDAIRRSMNIPTLNTTADVGINNVIDWAYKLGITTKLKAELGTGIGSSCVTPWEMSKVYLSFANLGEVIDPVLIKEVKDRNLNHLSFNGYGDDPWVLDSDRLFSSIKQFFGPKKRVMEVEDAYTMHYLLREVASAGTAQRSNMLGQKLSGKTGTTNQSFDTHFAGYTKNMLGLAWVGYDTMSFPLGVYEQGARTALPFFIDFAGLALKGLPIEDLSLPDGMCEARIDVKTGKRLLSNHPLSFVAPFRCGQEPELLGEVAAPSLDEALELMGGM